MCTHLMKGACVSDKQTQQSVDDSHICGTEMTFVKVARGVDNGSILAE